MSFNKILLAVFFLLFFVVISELGFYYFYILPKRSMPDNNNPPKVVSLVPTYTPTPTLIDLNSIESKTRNIATGVKISDIMTKKYQGNITKLDWSGGLFNGKSYKLKLVLKAKSDFGLIFTDQDLSIIKVIEQVQRKEKPITLQDLQVGDKVIITEIHDNLKNLNGDATDIQIAKIL